jgi:hypothetical protein
MKENQRIGWVKFWTPKDDWYYLSFEERKQYLSLFSEAKTIAKAKGANLIGVYKCRGQSEWMRFEVWEFLAPDDVIEFTRSLESIGHYQYFSESNTIGRKYERIGSEESWVI